MADLSNLNIIHHQEADISYIQFRKLLQYPEVKHAFTVDRRLDFRTHRNNKPHVNYNQALKNIELIQEKLGCSHNYIKANLEHSNNIAIIKKITTNVKYPDLEGADGLITNLNHQSLITTSADCIIFLLYDPIKKVIANVHSGWKGTLKKIVINAISQMQKEYDCQPQDIICCICPSIRQCHFEVDKDVYELYKNTFPKYQDTIIERQPKWHIDTVEINKRLLIAKGLKESNIIDSQICTVCHQKEINSCRADKSQFRLNVAVIELEVI